MAGSSAKTTTRGAVTDAACRIAPSVEPRPHATAVTGATTGVTGAVGVAGTTTGVPSAAGVAGVATGVTGAVGVTAAGGLLTAGAVAVATATTLAGATLAMRDPAPSATSWPRATDRQARMTGMGTD